jgi:hypothetical protein
MTTPEVLTGTFDVTDNNPHCCNVVAELAYSNIAWQSASFTITGEGDTTASTFGGGTITFLALQINGHGGRFLGRCQTRCGRSKKPLKQVTSPWR